MISIVVKEYFIKLTARTSKLTVLICMLISQWKYLLIPKLIDFVFVTLYNV